MFGLIVLNYGYGEEKASEFVTILLHPWFQPTIAVLPITP